MNKNLRKKTWKEMNFCKIHKNMEYEEKEILKRYNKIIKQEKKTEKKG